MDDVRNLDIQCGNGIDKNISMKNMCGSFTKIYIGLFNGYQTHLSYHSTILFGFDMPKMERRGLNVSFDLVIHLKHKV